MWVDSFVNILGSTSLYVKHLIFQCQQIHTEVHANIHLITAAFDTQGYTFQGRQIQSPFLCWVKSFVKTCP